MKIQDYTLHEIQNLFGLKDPHTLEDIVNADLNLTERINTDGSIDTDKKKQILTFLNKAKEKVLNNNQDKVIEFRKGKTKLLGFFVGLIMKETKGKANPKILNKILKNKLK